MDRVLALIRQADTAFYLTGGTALGRHYLHHRYSDDLDLFVNQAVDFRDQVKKALEALSRREPKDMADVLFIAQSFSFSWREIFNEARRKDLWVEPLEISKIIQEFPVEHMDVIKWAEPVDPGACAAALKTLHLDIFHGRNNSLCEKGMPHPMQNAKMQDLTPKLRCTPNDP